jgi:hypothetical protein
MTMELLERYLAAVGRYLPEAFRADTVAELRANLLERIDDRAEELGRPLTDADVAVVLQKHGKPEVVALRYLPQQSLIGPTVFPFYMLTLKRSLPLVVLISALAEGLALVSAPRGSVERAITGVAGDIFESVFISAAIVTLVFVGIEYGIRVNKLGSTWNTFDPFKLPAVPKQKPDGPKSLVKRTVELVVHCLWMAWIISLHWKMAWSVGSGKVGIMLPAGWAFAPAWHTFYVMLVVILSVQLVVKIVALAGHEPGWLELVTDPLAVVAIAWLAFGNELFVATSAAVSQSDLMGANHGVSIALRIAVVVSVIGIGKKSWQYLRQRRGMAMLAF